MSHRKLSDACRFALRAIAAHGGALDIYNRNLATHLRVVERLFPELIDIVPPPSCHHIGARPYFGARLTKRGIAYVTPHKIARARAHHAREVRP